MLDVPVSNEILMPCCVGCSADDDDDDFERIFFLAFKWLFWCKNTKKVQKQKFSTDFQYIFGHIKDFLPVKKYTFDNTNVHL